MKRHEFEMIAAALKSARPNPPSDTRNEYMRIAADAARVQHAACCRFVADALARGTAPSGNRSFDRERFLRDAGVQS
jgi:hypothetical protein